MTMTQQRSSQIWTGVICIAVAYFLGVATLIDFTSAVDPCACDPCACDVCNCGEGDCDCTVE